ncbi:MAG: molecular chaperone SurA [Betaproteobacteria bacterium]|nr:MAG: molecular chaperone SurA [Betaproteobacteria bacterium]
MRFLLAILPLIAWGTALAQSPRPEQAAPAHIDLIDRIVAVVNKEVITQYELTERMNRMQKELERRGTTLPARAEIERQVLERLIIEKVQLQYARETGVRVDDLELDRTVSRVAEGNKLSLTEFRQTLERDSIRFDAFREELRNEILMNRLRDREVTGKITVSEGEIENLLLEQSERKDTATEYNIEHILVRVPEQATPEQLESRRARAEEVVRRLRDGADFARLAATYSDAPDALQGGVMGWRSQQRLPELYVEALAGLKPGDISNVFRSAAGFHVLKLLELRGAGAPLLVEQAHVRHILVRTNDLVSEDEAKRKLLSLRERIVNGVNFAELARLNSDDGSASRGGDLGWIYPGDTVPEFERAFAELKPMDVSQPVKTPFGWHLIQVLERRTADMSSERRRIEARKAILDRKGDEAYQEWLRQLRDRAYIEIRVEER